MAFKFINFEQARKLKEIGYPQDCKFTHFMDIYLEDGNISSSDYKFPEVWYLRAFQENVVDWFREEKNIIILPYLARFVGTSNESVPPELRVNTFGCQIVYYNKMDDESDEGGNQFITLDEEFTSPDDVLSTGIDKVLELWESLK